MLSKYVWDNIAPEMLAQTHRHTFAGKPAVSNISGSLFLTEYYVTEQS